MTKIGKKFFSLEEVLRLSLGHGIYFSKRLAPPLAVCNGRLCLEDGTEVYKSDIDIVRDGNAIARITKAFGVTLFLVREHDNAPQWRSDDPERWLGYDFGFEPSLFHKKIFGDKVRIMDVYPMAEKAAKRQQKQWAIDHRLVKQKKSKKSKRKGRK